MAGGNLRDFLYSLFYMVRCFLNISISKRRPRVSGSQPFDGLRTQQLLLRSILHYL